MNYQKPDDVKDIFKREIIEVIMPFRANSSIWNENRYEVETLNTEKGKLVLIREKEIKER